MEELINQNEEQKIPIWFNVIGNIWLIIILSIPLITLILLFMLYSSENVFSPISLFQAIMITLYCVSTYLMKFRSSHWGIIGIITSVLASYLFFGILMGFGS